MTAVPSGADPKAWVGRQQHCSDVITTNLADRIAVTLGQPTPASDAALPPLWHWAYFQQPVPESELGVDGHAARGTFLPPADNRNRMWAGGDVEWLAPLLLDVAAHRTTTIVDVSEKTGSTGSLLFVTLRHDYEQNGQLAIREHQHIVYRQPSPPKLSNNYAIPQAQWSYPITPSETLLFRYSAVTFNTHRIHYDYPYTTKEEGYGGIVVHGPLIATLLVQSFCAAHPTAQPVHLTYRGLRPLVVPHTFNAEGRINEAGQAELWATNESGLAHKAQLRFKDFA